MGANCTGGRVLGVGGAWIMKVYIAIEVFPYEGIDILGVYSDESKAEKKKSEAERDDLSNGYNEFEIVEREVE